MTYPVLWHFPISHFNEKVRWALDYKAIPHTRRALFLEYLPMALWKTRQPSLPILIQNGRALADSTRIIEELERQQPDPPLYPGNKRMRQMALDLENFFDEELGPGLRAALIGPLLEQDPDTAIAALGLGQKPGVLRFARATFPVMRGIYKARNKITLETIKAGREKVTAALDRIEAQLQPSGYLVGDCFSIADLAAAALLFPVALPPEYPYTLPLSVIEHARQFSESMGTRPAVQWVRDMYSRHRGKSAEVTA